MSKLLGELVRLERQMKNSHEYASVLRQDLRRDYSSLLRRNIAEIKRGLAMARAVDENLNKVGTAASLLASDIDDRAAEILKESGS